MSHDLLASPSSCGIPYIATCLNDDERNIATLFDTVRACFSEDLAGDGKSWIAFAIVHAFTRHTKVPPQVAATLLNDTPAILESLEQILCFRTDAGAAELDPFLLFGSIAAESIPIPAIDEYLDLVQNRFFIWRRPSLDRISLGRALVDGNGSVDRYLEALQQLKTKPSYDRHWLGFTDGEGYIGSKSSSSHERNGLASSALDLEEPCCSLEDSYSCKISINISLAAREMKRRALGLEVVS
jgi:hypothetical protein